MQACLRIIPPLESVDIKTAAVLLGITDRALQIRVSKGDIAATPIRSIGGAGGTSYLIPLISLPPEAQMKWRVMQGQQAQNVDLNTYTERKAKNAVARANVSRKARAEEKRLRDEVARATLETLQAKIDAMEELKALAGKRGGVMDAKQAIADRLGVSLRQLYVYAAAYAAEGVEGLMDKTERADKGKPRTMCLMAQDYIEAEYCTSGKVRQNVVYDNVTKLAKSLGCSACDICPHNPGGLWRAEQTAQGKPIPYAKCDRAGNGMIAPANRHAVNRYIETIPKGVLAASRKGWGYWEAAHMPKVLRTKPEKVNECWFGDHHVFDLFVMYEGKPIRPWLTALMDARTNAIVGWVISPSPNSETILECLARAIAVTRGSPYSGSPMMLYIDNGKDYRCKRIEGDGKRLLTDELGKLNLDFEGDNAVLKTLGIGVTHAIPYRAWSKTIERVFGTIETRWIRGLPGYCENDIEERPETLAKDIRDQRLLTFNDFVDLWALKIWPEYNAFKAEGVAQSPLEIYQSSEKARTDTPGWDMLAMLKMFRAERKVRTTGVGLHSKTYNHPALAPYIGEWVTVLYTRNYLGSVTIVKDGTTICEAEDTSLNPYKLIGEDPERLAEHMRHQQAARRAVRERLQQTAERVQMLGAMACEIPEMLTNSSITSMVHAKAYRVQQEGQERIKAKREAKTAASKAAQGRLRAKCIAAGERLLQIGADSD